MFIHIKGIQFVCDNSAFLMEIFNPSLILLVTPRNAVTRLQKNEDEIYTSTNSKDSI